MDVIHPQIMSDIRLASHRRGAECIVRARQCGAWPNRRAALACECSAKGQLPCRLPAEISPAASPPIDANRTPVPQTNPATL